MENFTEILYNDKKPKSADEYYVSGLNYVIEGNEQGAIDAFIKCVKLDTNVIDAYYRLARLYESVGEFKKAIRILTDLLLRPVLPKILVRKIEDSLIEVYSRASQLTDAIALVLKKSQENPKDPRYKMILSRIYEEQEDWEQALIAYKAYAKLTKAVDTQKEARIKVGLCRDNYIHHPPSVIKQVKSILKVEPCCPSGYELLIEMYKLEQNNKGLIESWKQYMWHCPKEAAAEFKQMETDLFNVDQYTAVQDILEYASKNKNPDASAVKLLLIELYAKKDEKELIKAVLDHLLESSDVSDVQLKALLRVLEKLKIADTYLAVVNKKFLENE